MTQSVLNRYQDECLRLREGREDESTMVAETELADAALRAKSNANEDERAMAQPQGKAAHGALLRATRAHTLHLDVALDPRLGVQQPEGEPGQPMPYWRRSGV